MKIKTQVNISLILFVILSMLIVFTIFSANAQLQEIQKKQQIIDNIEKSSFELTLLENDYLVHGGKIPVKYWNAKNNELASRIQELSLTDPSQKTKLNEISESRKELNISFSNLVAVTNGELGMVPDEKSQEKQEFSESTLAGQTQTLISRSAELSEQVKAEASGVQQRTILLISFTFAVLIVFVILNYLFINRSVLTSISALRNGSEHIGSGDLDTKIEIKSNDELGDLSLAFNKMSSNLKDTRTLLLASNIELEQDVIERKRVEHELERKNQELMAANEQLAAAEEELKAQFVALAQSEEKFREIFDTINDGIQIHKIEPDGKPGKFIEVNAVACRMLQFTREELLNHGPIDFVGAYHSRPLNEIVRELSSTGHAVFETEHRRKDGTMIPVEINSHVVILQGKRVMVGVVRDITDRKVAQGILLRVNQKLHVLSELTRKDLTNQFFVLSSYLELAKKQLA
ncbi:MAG: PAS domain S-box protein, partial [Methanomicrobiales archaeon]